MAYLTVRCPKTNALLTPRVRIRTLEALEELGPENRMRCDHCGAWHDFDIGTAVIVEDDIA